MICSALNSITRNLHIGSKVREPVRPECQLTGWALNLLQLGKDESINHMLQNGNGYPEAFWAEERDRVVYDMGCTQERRDLRALHVWQSSLIQCNRDKGRNF